PRRVTAGSSVQSNIDSLGLLYGRGATSAERAQKRWKHSARPPTFLGSSVSFIGGSTEFLSYSRPYSTNSNFRTQLKGHWNSKGQQWFLGRAGSLPNLLHAHSYSKDSENWVRNISNKNQLDLTALEKILKMEASEIVMILAAPGTGLKDLLNREDHTNALTFTILEVLNKAYSSQTCKQNLRHLFKVVKDSLFLKKTVPKFLMNMDTEDQEKMEQRLSRLDKIVSFHLSLLEIFPYSTFTDVSLTTVLLENEYKRCQSASLKIPEESQNQLKNLQRRIAHLQQKKIEGILSFDQDTFRKSDLNEVKNFRSLPIYPAHKDVCSEETESMGTSSISGKFKDSSTYLDSCFHLIREGYVKPLRDRITQLLKFDKKDGYERRFDSSIFSHVYYDTTIVSPVCTRKGIVYTVRFDSTNLKCVNWEISANLLHGTLVCLSKDKFETMIWATVTERDVKKLTQGITTLSFTEESRLKLGNISPSDMFTMVDSTVAFEDYQSVLAGLQDIAAEDLPMQKYIVSCESNILMPKYLEKKQNSYNLQGLIDCKSLNRGVLGLQRERIQKVEQENPKGNMSSRNPNDILNLNDWPSKEELGLDYSQLKALQDALTKELAVIQGQPGTGKTYVGLKITRALVDNTHIWSAPVPCPILVLCPSNHVLDAFLEGVVQILPDASLLVRVGERSTSNILNDLSLDNLRKSAPFRQSLPRYLRSMHWQLCEERMAVEKELGGMIASLQRSSKGILHENVLGQYIVTLHGASLGNMDLRGLDSSQTEKQKSQSLMMKWLGISILSNSEDVQKDSPKEACDADSDSSEEEDCITDILSVDTIDGAWSGEDDHEMMLSVASTGDEEMEERLSILSSEMGEQDEMLEGIHVESPGTGSWGGRYAFTDQEKVMAMGVGTDEAELCSTVRTSEGSHDQERVQTVSLERPAIPQRAVLAYLFRENKGEKEEVEHGCSVNLEITREMKRSLETVVEVDHMLEVDAKQISDLWALPYKERWHLYRLWLSMYQKDVKATIINLELQYQAIVKRTEEVRLMEDGKILKQARVIGMTTSGAARYQKLLKEICPRVVLVEEAQEVPEGHIITTLSSACQHLILIGDQQQFCPCPTGKEQDHSVGSLFERLIQAGVPFVHLENQHRMQPDIAQVLTPHIYNKINNETSPVEKIKGVTTNVFFLDHKNFEKVVQRGHFHHNLHEATFVKSLCQYLVYQGYRASQITVLTPCVGQIDCLRKCMSKSMFLGVKICLVHEFQGKENDIIIVSLVRSNREGQEDLTKIPKDICTALSRAKKGFYCIGNMAMHSTVPMWSKILNAASSRDQIGEALMLRCEHHPNIVTAVSKDDDFLKVPLGGCSQPCGSHLSCGHVCLKPCHSNLEHMCASGCFTEGDIGQETHEQEAPHSCPPEDLAYPHVACGKPLPCGHTCASAPGHSCKCICNQKVTVDLQCGHQRSVQCHVWQEQEQQPIMCVSRCEELLICSHQCRGICGAPCIPCAMPCRTKCFHQKCHKSCLEACQPCSKKCGWLCSHHHCTKLCYERCDRPPCHMPCHKTLKCYHPCIGMCGEPCPRKCRICNADEVQELFFGNEANPAARFVELSDCRHIFEVTGFDSWISAPEEGGVVGFKSCPKCGVPIRRNLRHNWVVKSTIQDLNKIKKKAIVVLSTQVQCLVKEMEKKGIMSNFVPPLLSRLTDLNVNITQAVFIAQQITLLLQLSEIRKKVQTNMPDSLSIINYQINLLSKEISQAKGKQLPEYEQHMRRILLLAEAYTLRGRYTPPQLSEPFSLEAAGAYEKLNAVIADLSKMSIQEKDVKSLRRNLNDIACKINLPLNRQFLEETSKVSMNFDFLRLNHWSKCSNGHIYHNRAVDDGKSAKCDECLKT
ncbi:NFX1-type zinc finger-containing protein 1-like, partial [Arapaima gigas]